MRRTRIMNSCQVRRTTFQEAEKEFYKHCVLRNLRNATLRFYREDLTYFHGKVPVKYMDDLNQEAFDKFIFHELEEGKKVISLNTRIRGLRVFLEREYHNTKTHGPPCKDPWVFVYGLSLRLSRRF